MATPGRSSPSSSTGSPPRWSGCARPTGRSSRPPPSAAPSRPTRPCRIPARAPSSRCCAPGRTSSAGARRTRTCRNCMRSGLVAAREALAATPRQLEVLARSHVVDAGGQGFVFFLEGLIDSFTGNEPAWVPDRGPPARSAALLRRARRDRRTLPLLHGGAAHAAGRRAALAGRGHGALRRARRVAGRGRRRDAPARAHPHQRAAALLRRGRRARAHRAHQDRRHGAAAARVPHHAPWAWSPTPPPTCPRTRRSTSA